MQGTRGSMTDCCAYGTEEYGWVWGSLGEVGTGRGSGWGCSCTRVYTAEREVGWDEAFWDQKDRLRLMERDEDKNLGHYGKTVSVRVDVWMR